MQHAGGLLMDSTTCTTNTISLGPHFYYFHKRFDGLTFCALIFTYLCLDTTLNIVCFCGLPVYFRTQVCTMVDILCKPDDLKSVKNDRICDRVAVYISSLV